MSRKTITLINWILVSLLMLILLIITCRFVAENKQTNVTIDDTNIQTKS